MKGILIICIFILFAISIYATIRKLDIFMDKISGEKAKLNEKVFFSFSPKASTTSGNCPSKEDIT